MKKTVVRLTFFCVGLVFTSLVLTSISDAEIDMTGARAIWLFDEGEGDTTSDISGNDFHATLVNGPVWTDGKFGAGVSFDGADDYVEANAPVVVETVDFTMGLWLNPGETQSQWANVLSSHGSDPGPPEICRGMSIEQVSDSANLFYFIAGGGGKRLLAWSSGANPTGSRCLAAFRHCTARGYIDTLPERRGIRGGTRSKRYTLCTCHT